ncbi:uncharacterized protein LOC115696343 [Cannabis sativa]|uniref:uncharacterized protein LOC115696343 n=1 Tax=Cannabis sativa TaxID=3483 RepID=UPI0011DF5E45|nr:uncharacterized protein LOC115696343 [Cannabis sativa]
MRGIAWNCRGLGQTSTVRELKSLIRLRSPNFIFLTELKVDASSLLLVVREIGDIFGGPWLILGNTNFVLSESERVGSKGRDQFIPVISNLVNSRGLISMAIQGDCLTWDNHHSGTNHVKSALDKGLANGVWISLFPKAALYSSQTSTSDHRPLCLLFGGLEDKIRRSFKFQEAWTRDERSRLVVDSAWKSQFGKIDTLIRDLERRLDLIQMLPVGSRDWETERNLRSSLNEARVRKDLYWKKRVRVSWLKDGDKCSKFFFLTASIRGRRNAVECILNKDNMWISKRQEIGNEFMEFFQGIFTGSETGIEMNCIDLIHDRLSLEDQAELIRRPSCEKIKATLFFMSNNKAPRPDGMSVLFFKHYWESVENDFCEAVLDFFHSGRMHKGVNATNIVLNPKVQNPKRPSHFRPISLCNVVYKVISKIIANRIKPVLPRLICPTQAAFVPGRNIQDNNVIAQEIILSFNRKKGREGLFAIKIDLMKAYDRMSWRFIDHIIDCFGGGPIISHIFFVDDLILVGKANLEEAKGYWDCLEKFCSWSGQKVNKMKTSIFFSQNTPNGMKQGIKALLGIGSPEGNVKYLGLPLFRSRQKDADFNFILDNLTSKLHGWKAKTLSKAGRATLIKSVGLSLPMYAMQTTKLSNRLATKIDGLVRDFWWGSEKVNHGLHLKAWDKFFLPKSLGGLGF